MSLKLFSDEFFMREALKEAQKAFEKGEVPVGAVVVCNNSIIAGAHNLTETLNDVTAHAEMQAFTSASDFMGAKYLPDCILYVTIEPCVMCAGASYWTQITKLVYGAGDPKKGFSVLGKNILHPSTEVISGILENECGDLMRTFFKSKR